MEKKLKDYLPYYIGCRFVTPDGIGQLVGVPWGIGSQDRVTIHFGKWVKTVNSIDGGYDRVRNYGDYALEAKRYEPIDSEGITEDGFDMPGGVKPILRKLEDITDEEKKHIGLELKAGTDNVECLSWKHISPFTSIHLEPKVFHYLLKQGFDLWDLIGAGLAINEKELSQSDKNSN